MTNSTASKLGEVLAPGIYQSPTGAVISLRANSIGRISKAEIVEPNGVSRIVTPASVLGKISGRE